MGTLATILGSIVQGLGLFFGFKKEQAQVMGNALEVLKDVNASVEARAAAQASIIVAETTNGYWLSSVWRPWVMVIFTAMVLARWFGYTPSNMSEAELLEVYGLLKLGLGGYIGGRSLEKILAPIIGPLGDYIRKKVG